MDSGTATELPARERVELILSQLDKLPTLSTVAVRLLALTTSDDSSAGEVIQVIESDASLTTAILRLGRRADAGAGSEVTTVKQAVTLLGFNAVRNAVLSLQLYETLGAASNDDRTMATRRGLWQHSLAVACASEMVAEQSNGAVSLGDAFVAGLLHDIGKIALEATLPKSYARVVGLVERRRSCICDVEQSLLGMDHTVAGKRLASRWHLPQPMVECAWLHHQSPEALPTSVASPQLVSVVHVADNLVRQQRIGFSGYQHVGDVEELVGSWGIEPTALEAIRADLPQRMEPFCELVGLDDTSSQSLYAESLAKANRELGRLNRALTVQNERLEVRSACFDALRSFTKQLTERDRVGEVCVTAARSIGQMVGAQETLGFAREAGKPWLHTGSFETSERAPSTGVIELDRALGEALDRVAAAAASSRGIIAAPEGGETIWQRCVGAHAASPLWILPFAETDGTVGGVLFTLSEGELSRLRSASEEAHAVSIAIGLAVSTARARAELERTNEELLDLNRRFRAAQKGLVRERSVSMVAKMAAGAAHELNNPLSVISGRAQMARGRCTEDELARTLEIIVEQAQTAAQMVTDLMDFAKPAPPQPVGQRLAEVLDPLCQHWRTRSSLAEPQITLSLADPEATVYADAGQLRIILNAVMANAVEACPPETACLQINSPSKVSDETVRIVIEDNGTGMTPDVLEHAVDPFFSSRPAGRGRGLGLSHAYRLAEMSGGNLWLDSTPGIGTTVTVELPARPPTS